MIEGKTIDCKKLIKVYDNMFSYNERYKFFHYIKNSYFKTEGSDGADAIQHDNIHQIFSNYSTDDVDKMGFSQTDFFQSVAEEYNFWKREIKQIRINLSPPSERNFIHTDADGITLLYYASMEWKPEWGGHTFFMSDDLSEVEYASLYTPGRVMIFDGTVPHMILTPTMMCPIHRYTFAIQFTKVKD